MDKLNVMNIFIHVVEHLSLTKAAHVLKMAPSNISQRLTDLELHLGVILLNRTTRNLTITKEGEVYYHLCKKILNEISTVESDFEKTKRSGGHLRINVYDALTSHIILPILTDLYDEYPDMTLDVVQYGYQFDSKMDVASDVLIRFLVDSLPSDLNMVCKEFPGISLVYAASPDYLERKGKPMTPYELGKHDCIGYIDPWSGRYWDWVFTVERGSISFDIKHKIGFTNTYLITQAAKDGYGIFSAFLPNIQESLIRGELQLVLEEWSGMKIPIYAFYQKSRRDYPPLNSLIGFLSERLL